MFIGEVSNITGASIKAIRFYEKIGLLTNVKRYGRYRVYNKEHLTLIQLILKAKTLGFKLAEMKLFVDDKKSRNAWDCIIEMINVKLDQTDIEIRRLKQQDKTLERYKKDISDCITLDPGCSIEHLAFDSTL